MRRTTTTRATASKAFLRMPPPQTDGRISAEGEMEVISLTKQIRVDRVSRGARAVA